MMSVRNSQAAKQADSADFSSEASGSKLQWLLAVILAILGHADCASSADDLFVMGYGLHECASYLRVLEQERTARPPGASEGQVFTAEILNFIGFMNGLLTGLNIGDPLDHEVGNNVSGEARVRWLENYCTQHPDAKFVVAAVEFRNHLVRENHRGSIFGWKQLP